MHSNPSNPCSISCRGFLTALTLSTTYFIPATVLAEDKSLTNVSATASVPSAAIAVAPRAVSPSQRAIQLNEQAVKLIFDGKQEKGRAKIEEALKLDPENPTVLYNYAGICLTEGKSRDAVGAMNKAVKAEPDDLALCNRLSEAHFAYSDISCAI